jgi:predicted 3-demethylubiquinone-9 3-methyltransferase (glyoxalase superfamily)
MQKIVPCVWYATQAKEAAALYTSVFANSGIDSEVTLRSTPEGSTDVIDIHLGEMRFKLMNAGGLFVPTPAVSFFATFATPAEIDAAAGRLLEGGVALMPVGSYPFSAYYGWVMDRWGVSWQLMVTDGKTLPGSIVPSLLFVNDNDGKAEEAAALYTRLFPGSQMGIIEHYPADAEPPNTPGTVRYADFTLAGQRFSAIDGGNVHDFTFNEAISFVILCESQQEIDHFWEGLSAVPEAEMCGWLKDRFGVSWQVVPQRMGAMMTDADGEKVGRVAAAFRAMKKLDIAALERAYAGADAPTFGG